MWFLHESTSGEYSNGGSRPTRELRGASAMQIIHRISPPCPVPTQLQLVLEYKILSLQHQLNDSIRTPRINLSLHLKAQTPKVH